MSSSTARTGLALLLANIRYWTTVAPLTRTQLSGWKQRADAIPDPQLRALACRKLQEERFNAEVASTLATLAPRVHRKPAVEAIVALQVLYDYLDLLGEQAPAPGDAHKPYDSILLFKALTDAVETGAPAQGYYSDAPEKQDGGYLEQLVAAVRAALARLPAFDATSEVMGRSAARCAEAQIRTHAASQTGLAELERWARTQAAESGMGWREFLAGASASVLALHALIAAAAERQTTYVQAVKLDALYLSIGALTMLDSLIDYQADMDASRPGYLQYYDNDRDELARSVAGIARNAAAAASSLPNGAHHRMTLIGVVAYYGSEPNAKSELAKPVFARVNRELKPLITPTLALMRSWRLLKRLRR